MWIGAPTCPIRMPRRAAAPDLIDRRFGGLTDAVRIRPQSRRILLERPFNAIIGIRRVDGSILLTPVWHLFRDGAFSFQVPGGDRKIRMLERDARVSLIVAEGDRPYRAIEASGRSFVGTWRPTIQAPISRTICSTAGSSCDSRPTRSAHGITPTSHTSSPGGSAI